MILFWLYQVGLMLSGRKTSLGYGFERGVLIEGYWYRNWKAVVVQPYLHWSANGWWTYRKGKSKIYRNKI